MTKARYDDLVEEIEVLKLRVAALETQAVTHVTTLSRRTVTQELSRRMSSSRSRTDTTPRRSTDWC